MTFSDFSGGLSAGFAPAGTYQSGPTDGNYPGQGGSKSSSGMPNITHSAVVVGIIVIVAIALLVLGVIGFRASGEVVI
jgi:hypothetical protein